MKRGKDRETPIPISLYTCFRNLFIQIRADKAVKGFTIGTVDVKLTSYADNTTF